jgi:hypothetical protein
MQGEWKPFLAACLIALCVGGGFGVVALGNSPQQATAAAHDSASNGSKDSEGWSLSDKIALVASIAGLLQAGALVVTIRVMIRNGRRQFRAYVFVENAWAKLLGHENDWTIEYKLKNTGLTPAKRVTVIETTKVVSWPMTTLPEPVNRGYFGTMAPNGDFIDDWSGDEVLADPEDILGETKGHRAGGRSYLPRRIWPSTDHRVLLLSRGRIAARRGNVHLRARQRIDLTVPVAGLAEFGKGNL